jgi:adenylate cyclase
VEAEPLPLSAAELADLVGVTAAEVERMADLGILVRRDAAQPYLPADAHKVRLAVACEQAGLPMEGISAAIRSGKLSFAFLEASVYGRWAVRSTRTYRQVSEDTGLPLEVMRTTLEAMGFSWPRPDELIREDELEVVPLLALVHATGVLDQGWLSRVGRGWAEGLRVVAKVENEAYHERFEMPMLRSGMSQREALERASQLGGQFNPLVDRAMIGMYRRQQELGWTEHLVEHIEVALEEEGALGRSTRVPAMCFLDLVGYTRLTEERGDQAAAELAATLAVLVGKSAREYRGAPVKWLGDGVMFHFQDPTGAVLGALRMVDELPPAGLPPAHVGVAAGPVVQQGGDYFGRTVNLTARIAARAAAGQVLVSRSVVEATAPDGVAFAELDALRLKGIADPVRVFEARRA